MFVKAMRKSGTKETEVIINMTQVLFFDTYEDPYGREEKPVTVYRVNLCGDRDIELTEDSYNHLVNTQLKASIAKTIHEDEFVSTLKGIQTEMNNIGVRVEEIRDILGLMNPNAW